MNNGNDKTIVGIDPGTTSAVAVLDLRGNHRRIESGKNFSDDKIINSILKEGTPILISTDKAKVPSAVQDISSNFKASTFSPDEDLPIERKKDIVEGYDYGNLHERDALAAAVYAYHNYENKFRNIEKRTDELNLQNLSPRIKELVITDEVENVSEAIEKVLKNESDDKKPEKASFGDEISKKDLKEKIENYRKNLLEKRKDNEKLSENNESLKERIKDLEKEKKRLKKDINEIKSGKRDKIMEKEEIKRLKRNIKSKENEIRKLKRRIDDKNESLSTLKTYERLRKEGKIPLRDFKEVPEENLRKSDRNLSLDKSVILLDDMRAENESVIGLFEELGVKAVVGNFSGEFEDELISRGIWSIPLDKVEINEEKEIKYLDRDIVEKFKKSDRGSFIGWLKRYRDKDD